MNKIMEALFAHAYLEEEGDYPEAPDMDPEEQFLEAQSNEAETLYFNS